MSSYRCNICNCRALRGVRATFVEHTLLLSEKNLNWLLYTTYVVSLGLLLYWISVRPQNIIIPNFAKSKFAITYCLLLKSFRVLYRTLKYQHRDLHKFSKRFDDGNECSRRTHDLSLRWASEGYLILQQCPGPRLNIKTVFSDMGFPL